MSKLFRPKTMRRMVVFLAMIAPVVYLFGSLFSALNGAHGESVLADGETSYISDEVEFNGAVYHRVMYYPDSDVNVSVPYTDGEYTLYVGQHYYYCANSNPVVNGLEAASSLSDFDYYLSLRVVSGGVYYTSFLRDNQCIALSVDGYWLLEVFGKTIYLTYGTAPSTYYDYVALSFHRQPCSFSDLLGGSSSINSYRKIPLVQPTIVIPASVNESEYLFGQFFDRDNFLVQWGQNAISENPYGFAPFGYFWRYLDTNVLHLSHEQVGLMAYGYLYYASHVLLFDVGFILVTFFLTFIQKVADKIGGEDHA